MNTLMITSMDQGKGFVAEALQPVPLFETAARVVAILKTAIALTRQGATPPPGSGVKEAMMENAFMASVGELIEARTRVVLEREFGTQLPRSTDRLLSDVGFFDQHRWQKKPRRQLFGGTLGTFLAHLTSFRGAHA